MGKLSYEDLVKEEKKRKGQKPESLAKTAIAARGGHCIDCEHCTKIFVVMPKIISTQLRADNLSVRAKCKIDTNRVYPFQNVTSGRESCPSIKRHQKRQKQISE